ncbi:MAG: response regulator transcription factor [Polyangiales bacterium]
MAAKETRRALVVDDHPLVRQGMALLLEDLRDAWAVSEAGTLAEAVALLGDEAHDLVLLDYHLPDTSGVLAFDRCRAAAPKAHIVVLTADDDAAKARELLSLGARGFIAKSSAPEIIVAALELVLRGGVYAPFHAAPTPPPSSAGLTDRQEEVLALVVEGRTNKEIATHLGTSESTVRAHLTSIFRVLGVTNRTQAARVAMQRR